MSEFKSFPKIERIDKLYMTITQKIHGTNAQILIDDTGIYAGSRSRWLTPEDDNHGFARWVQNNQNEIIQTLGVGRHYGEWCGKGINAGEGLPDKRFVLFDWYKYVSCDRRPLMSLPLMESVTTVPVLYTGAFSYEVIDTVMHDLKINGSRLMPGYMKPEGIVIDINGTRYKKVFDDEDVKWNRSDAPKIKVDCVDVTHLLQPRRLEKLLSRDEKYRREYPENLRKIFADYYLDLVDEKQIDENADDIKSIKRALGSQLFRFIRHHIECPELSFFGDETR